MTVGTGRLEARVRVLDPVWVRTSAVPGLSARVFAVLPGLERHRCESGSAHGIRAELADTETAHLLEHVALELMVLAGSPRTLRGETTWDFGRDGRNVFRVRLEYDDDLVAIGALQAGATIVEAVLRGAPVPDVAAEADRLSALRERD